MARSLRRRARLGYSVVVKIDAVIVCVLFVGLSFWQPLAARPHPLAPRPPQNQTEAPEVRALRLAAEQGDAEAQRNLGVRHVEGDGVPQDDAAAVQWFRLAADQGLPAAQRSLGYMYAAGRGVPQDAVEAIRLWRLAAAGGDAGAQANLGSTYAQGNGVRQDDAEAVRWFRLAADQGHADAQNQLGLMHVQGRGVPQNAVEAVRLWRLAAERGNAGAQRNLGVAHAQGDGVPQDDAEALRWYRLAADQRDADAQANLGLMHGEGRGVPQDDAEAARWLRLAADQGHAEAEHLLGLMDVGGGGEPTLQDALDVPAIGLSQAYRLMEGYLDFLFAAEGGGTIQTPEGTIDKSNVHQYRERFEARLKIYRAAIEQRGYESFAGNYDASATESCSRAGSAWAGVVSEGAVRGVEIVQQGFAIQLTTKYEVDGEIQSFETQPVAVESVMTFDDPGNSD